MTTISEAAEQLYEYTLRLTRITEYGADLGAVLTGQAKLPASGLRVDIAFEGTAEGRLAGTIEGIDYLNLRADGRMELDIRAELTTADGAKIAMTAGGVGRPQAGSTASALRENVKLTTAHPDWAWVNPLEIWAVGEADIATGVVHVRGYVL
jgi:hypothetical protein